MDSVPSRSVMLSVRDVSLELYRHGSGPCIVVLHGIEGPGPAARLCDRLASQAEVIAPSHPGFGGSPLPPWFDGVDDLAYVYLDLFEQLGLRNIVLVGCGLGGWIAAEIATKCTHRIARIVWLGALGIKVGDRETRDLPDIYALPLEEVTKLLYHDAARAPAVAALGDGELEQLARQRESAALYLWEPYMHNPKLRRRLRRIDVPALYLRGAGDGLVSMSYAQAYCAAVPGARLEIVEGAGHFPELEQTDVVARKIVEFAVLPRQASGTQAVSA